MRFDIAVIGGGIVGLASAHSLIARNSQLSVLILEKESGPAHHQTGHNSGVIHSGIYYAPGSLKALFAKQGGQKIAEFCQEHGIAHEICGKVVVATAEEELPGLDALQARSAENGILVNRLSAAALRDREPHVSGIAALEVPSAGIADYPAVAQKLAELITKTGNEIWYGSRVEKITVQSEFVHLSTNKAAFEARFLISCAGLQSDRVTRMSGADPGARIIPFRGEYYTLKPSARHLIQNLVYPLPNPAFPFLGVHFTRMVSGEIHAGPNAVLALKREGYHKADFSLRDLAELIGYSGFRKMAVKHWREGLEEMHRSFSRAAFLASLQRLVPEITDNYIDPSPAGVRAMAVKPDGAMIDDFLVVGGQRSLHICNAPSPAATASLEIGEYVATRAEAYFGLRN